MGWRMKHELQRMKVIAGQLVGRNKGLLVVLVLLLLTGSWTVSRFFRRDRETPLRENDICTQPAEAGRPSFCEIPEETQFKRFLLFATDGLSEMYSRPLLKLFQAEGHAQLLRVQIPGPNTRPPFPRPSPPARRGPPTTRAGLWRVTPRWAPTPPPRPSSARSTT